MAYVPQVCYGPTTIIPGRRALPTPRRRTARYPVSFAVWTRAWVPTSRAVRFRLVLCSHDTRVAIGAQSYSSQRTFHVHFFHLKRPTHATPMTFPATPMRPVGIGPNPNVFEHVRKIRFSTNFKRPKSASVTFRFYRMSFDYFARSWIVKKKYRAAMDDFVTIANRICVLHVCSFQSTRIHECFFERQFFEF